MALTFQSGRRKLLYIGGDRVDMAQVTSDGTTSDGRSRIHNVRISGSLVPICVTTGQGDMTLTVSDATAFPAVGALVTVSQSANTEQAFICLWGV